MTTPSRWHMLVVEDDADGQEVMATILSHLQISYDVAGNASQAENFLYRSGTHYHGAIIDLALPDKDGWQVLSDILDNDNTSSLPCIAVTAYHTSKLREDALKAGFVAYFPKPVDATAFGRALENIL